jgi:hypothetical protein
MYMGRIDALGAVVIVATIIEGIVVNGVLGAVGFGTDYRP